MTTWCDVTYQPDGNDRVGGTYPARGVRCALEAGHPGEHLFARSEPLPDDPWPESVHSSIVRTFAGVSSLIGCSCGWRAPAIAADYPAGKDALDAFAAHAVDASIVAHAVADRMAAGRWATKRVTHDDVIDLAELQDGNVEAIRKLLIEAYMAARAPGSK